MWLELGIMLNILTQNVNTLLDAGHFLEFQDILYDVNPLISIATETDFKSQFDINLVRNALRNTHGVLAQMATPRIALFFEKKNGIFTG